jgi:hypothetical protein
MRRRKCLTIEPLECRDLPSGFAASLTTNQLSYQAGQPVAITLTLTNTDSTPAQLAVSNVSSGFIVTEGGQTVWQSNAGINPLVVELEIVAPGNSYSFHATWDGTLANGRSVTTTTGSFTVTNQLEPDGPSASFQIVSPLSYGSSVSSESVTVGQPIGFTYSITNTSDQPVTFDLAPSDFSVSWNGAAIWESDPGGSSQASVLETLQPAQSITETASWNGVATEGPLAGTNAWDSFRVSILGAPAGISQSVAIESPLTQTVTVSPTTDFPGQPIQFTAVETNVSDQPITILNSNDTFTVLGAGAITLPSSSGSVGNSIVLLQSGQSQTFTAAWNPALSPGFGTNPSGTDTVLFQDNFQGTGSAPFVVEGLSADPNSANVAATLTASHATSQPGKPVRFALKLKNLAKTRASLDFGPAASGIVILDGSTVVWKRRLATPAAKTLRPGKTIKLEALWTGKPNQAGVKTVAPGTYTIIFDAGGYAASTEIRVT